MIQRENDGVRWELQPDFAPLLDALLKSPGETIKESPVKRVTRHGIGGKTFYVKRYFHHAVTLRPLKFYFKRTQARQEWDIAQQLEERKIPIVRHVALGERRTLTGVQESILITEGFDGVTLDQVPDVDPVTVLRFVERMHNEGAVQKDLHLENLLINRASSQIRLVDLHGTCVRPRLDIGEREENLALLRMYLPVPVSATIERQSRDLRKRLLHERSRRCLRNNREFGAQQHGGLNWQVRLPFLSDAVRRVLDDPDSFLQSRAVILKPGRTSTVGKADGLVLKRFNFRKVLNLFKDIFRPSRARRAFQKAYHLELAGIPTAKPLAAAQIRVYGILIRSFVLMEEIDGAKDVGAWLKAGGEVNLDLVKRAAELIGRLHEEGFTHRDLKLSNLVLGREGKLWVLDLDGLTFAGRVPTARARADLDRLLRSARTSFNLQPFHIQSFLRHYCRIRRLGRPPG